MISGQGRRQFSTPPPSPLSWLVPSKVCLDTADHDPRDLEKLVDMAHEPNSSFAVLLVVRDSPGFLCLFPGFVNICGIHGGSRC